MRVLIGAALAAFLVAAPAGAQTQTAQAPTAQAQTDTSASALSASRCGAFPAAPGGAPDGANANAQAMSAYDETFRVWAAAADAVVSCRNAELEAVRAEYDALGARYRAESESARAQITAWQAEVTEFNERTPQPRRSR